MTILLCLPSDQHVPNLLSVHHFRPDRLVLVESSAMKGRQIATNFLNALNLGGLDYSGRCEIAPLDAEDNLEAVRHTLGAVYAKYPADRWIANITGGTKPMSLGSYDFFKEKGSRLIYTNVVRPAELMDIDAGTKETCTYRPSIDEFLAGYGFECPNRNPAPPGSEAREQRIWDCARAIAAHARPRGLLQLSDDERSRAREKGILLAPGDLCTPDPELLYQIATTFSLNPDTGAGKLSPKSAEFFTGGWLEVFCSGLIARHADALGCWDVRMGLNVHRCGNASGNELDVAFMHDHRLSMIECKSGAQGHDQKGDILYKVAAITLQFRALRVQSYLATTASNILNRGSLKEHIQTRADIYSCRVLTADTLRNLAHHSDDTNLIRTTFFGPKSVNAHSQ